jgi:hypothetical protein
VISGGKSEEGPSEPGVSTAGASVEDGAKSGGLRGVDAGPKEIGGAACAGDGGRTLSRHR